jgi:hypothetical protein
MGSLYTAFFILKKKERKKAEVAGKAVLKMGLFKES